MRYAVLLFLMLVVAGCVSGGEKATVAGQFVKLEDCTGVVDGTLITDYGNTTLSDCENAEMFNGKILQVTGYVYEQECEGEGCFYGPYMKDVESIETVG